MVERFIYFIYSFRTIHILHTAECPLTGFAGNYLALRLHGGLQFGHAINQMENEGKREE